MELKGFCVLLLILLHVGHVHVEIVHPTITLDKAETPINMILPILYIVMMFIACTLLLITLIVHILIWEKQDVQMWIVLSYIASLLLLYIVSGMSVIAFSMSSSNIEHDGTNMSGDLGCVVTGAVTHLLLLTTFCWLTSITENLWSTTRNLSISSPSTEEDAEQGWARYIWFSTFSWGIPALVVGCGLMLDYFYKNTSFLIPPPKYGESLCFLSSNAEGWYLFYPLAVLAGFNVIFFGLTIFRVILYEKITGHVIGQRSEEHWKPVNMYLKLLKFALLIWVLGATVWILKLETYTYFWFLGFLNLLQSLLIFTILTWRMTILEQIVEKYPCFSRWNSIRKILKLDSDCEQFH